MVQTDEHDKRDNRGSGPPTSHSLSFRGAVNTGWQLSLGHHAPGQPTRQLECPALLYDPTVFDVILVPHPLVKEITEKVNEYMRKQSWAGFPESEARFYGEDPKDFRRHERDAPIPVQCPGGHRVHRKEASLDPLPRADRPTSAARHTNVPTPSSEVHHHSEVDENVSPDISSQAQSGRGHPSRHYPPPSIQRYLPPPPPGRGNYYRTSQSSVSSNHQSSRAPGANPTSTSRRSPAEDDSGDDDANESKSNEAHIRSDDEEMSVSLTEPEAPGPKSPYYDTEGESEVEDEYDELDDEPHDDDDDDDDDDDNDDDRAQGPRVRRDLARSKNGKTTHRVPTAVVRRGYIPPHAPVVTPATDVPASRDSTHEGAQQGDNDVDMIIFGERPGVRAGSGSSESPRSESPMEAMEDFDDPAAPARRRKPYKRLGIQDDTNPREAKRARPSPPPSGTGRSAATGDANASASLCLWRDCPDKLNLRNGEASKKHIQEHINRMKTEEGLSGESVQCRWEGCEQQAKLENLARHASYVHLRLSYVCQWCGKSLARKDALKRHCASQHPNVDGHGYARGRGHRDDDDHMMT